MRTLPVIMCAAAVGFTFLVMDGGVYEAYSNTQYLVVFMLICTGLICLALSER